VEAQASQSVPRKDDNAVSPRRTRRGLEKFEVEEAERRERIKAEMKNSPMSRSDGSVMRSYATLRPTRSTTRMRVDQITAQLSAATPAPPPPRPTSPPPRLSLRIAPESERGGGGGGGEGSKTATATPPPPTKRVQKTDRVTAKIERPSVENKAQSVEEEIRLLEEKVAQMEVEKERTPKGATPQTPEEKDKLKKQRTDVVSEIIETEVSYIGKLSKVVSEFLTPLREIVKSESDAMRFAIDGKPLTKDNLGEMFGNIEMILGFNRQLLEELQIRKQSWSDTTLIGDVFLRLVLPLFLSISFSSLSLLFFFPFFNFLTPFSHLFLNLFYFCFVCACVSRHPS
jgi:hypothetical protein